MSRILRLALMASAVLLGCALAEAQSLRALPSPTGPTSIGRISIHWIDRARLEQLSPNHDYRELMVDIWYPAEHSDGKSAEYLDAPAFERALGAAGFQRQFGDASEVVRAGLVQTHAVTGAPFSRSVARSPILIFSPGGG